MNKVALFDFCETIANFQTADAYVDFVRERLQDKRMRRLELIQNILIKLKFIQVIEKITKYRFSINKRIKLWQLRGLRFEELRGLAKEYYQCRIRSNFISDILDEMLKLKEKGYSVLLVSGGYDLYLNFFSDEFGVTDILSTKIEFHKGICTGKIDGKDCLGDEKVKQLNKYFKTKPDYSVAFSDSISDLPFLKWAKEGFVVSRNKHQSWCNINNLNEIIWQE